MPFIKHISMDNSFSVLMTTYKGETPGNLDNSLRSILIDQSLIPSQVVVVEDGALTDELESVIVKYETDFKDVLQVIRCKINQGQSKASAEGLKYISNEVFARMDSDDVSTPTRFERQYSYLTNHPEIGVVGGWIAEFDDNPEKPQFVRKVKENHDDIVKEFKRRMPLNNVTVMMRKKDVIEAGGYGRNTVNEDYSLYAHMWVNGTVFHNLQEVLVNVRVGNNMLGRRTDFRIFRDWVKDQLFLAKSRKHNLIESITSCFLCFCFIIIPPNLKSFIYKHFLRKAV